MATDPAPRSNPPRLAPVWQERFEFFDRYGQPNATPQARAAMRGRGFVGQLRLNSNVMAFLFGPVYFFVKGMWRKGLTILIAGVALLTVLGTLGLPFGVLQAVTFGVSAVAMMTANYAYYLPPITCTCAGAARRGTRTRDSEG